MFEYTDILELILNMLGWYNKSCAPPHIKCEYVRQTGHMLIFLQRAVA